jgi:hypothetical protein
MTGEEETYFSRFRKRQFFKKYLEKKISIIFKILIDFNISSLFKPDL